MTHPDTEVFSEDYWSACEHRLKHAVSRQDLVAAQRHAVRGMRDLLTLTKQVACAFDADKWLRWHLFLPHDALWNRYVALMAMEVRNANQGHFGSSRPLTEEALKAEWELSGLLSHRP